MADSHFTIDSAVKGHALGGKSPAIVLQDADIETAVSHYVRFCFMNSGQSCNAPTRLIVPKSKLAEAERIAASIAAEMTLGDPLASETSMGPVVNRRQFDAVRIRISQGLSEGAKLVCGGNNRPANMPTSYDIMPTVFSNCTRGMSIARNEVFGPVVAIIGYDTEDEAIEIGNDTIYGLSAFIWSADRNRAASIGRRLRVGMVHINGARADPEAPFGGVKQSGNGRERGRFGIDEFTELKSVFEP